MHGGGIVIVWIGAVGGVAGYRRVVVSGPARHRQQAVGAGGKAGAVVAGEQADLDRMPGVGGDLRAAVQSIADDRRVVIVPLAGTGPG